MKNKKGRQGRLFRVRLGKRWLSLWLMGVFPLGFVRLAKVNAISQSTRSDFWQCGWRRVFLPWRYWFWPGVRGARHPRPSLFLLETEKGTRVWMYLRAGLHYQLREAVHRNRLQRGTASEVSLGQDATGYPG